MNNMTRSKTTPFKTALTEHVHIISDAKGRRKVPKYLFPENLMLTITHNAYKNKSDGVEFCIKEFLQEEYEQYGTTEASQITITVFANSQSKIAAGF